MQLDTRAAMSIIISEDMKHALFPDKQLRLSDAVLRTYTSETVSVIGELEVEVKYEAQTKHLSLLVVPGSGPSLIGHDWMSHITFNWAEVNKYLELFKDELGTKTNLRPNWIFNQNQNLNFSVPTQFPLPYRIALKLNYKGWKMPKLFLRWAIYSEWAAPIVAVPKKDSKLRICGDYKVTINPSMKVVQHP